MSFRQVISFTIVLFIIIGSSAGSSSEAATFLVSEGIAHFPPISISLQTGDVILRRGESLVSELIARSFDKSEGMSHCGFIIMMSDGYYVVHTISKVLSGIDGIRITPLKDFIQGAKGRKYCIIRYHKPIDGNALKTKNIKYLKQRVPFDDDFDLDDARKMYCTELIRQVYLDLGEPDFFHYRKVLGKPVIDFSTFFDTRLFGLIYKNY
ncbi:MAG: YiiX/YebB-like N1pC/P60 family cysteine hydrolase [Candidatus Cloacimonetes bacterium]|nr:YiiX/YebB-like N1pC/P60 family cysteine hydrolase [Candidatus Cloacimonadota bacterium]